MRQETEICHPTDERLIFSAIHHEEEPETGESGYSLGSPKIPEHYEITAVLFCGTDITDFVTQYADNLLPEWEDALLND